MEYAPITVKIATVARPTQIIDASPRSNSAPTEERIEIRRTGDPPPSYPRRLVSLDHGQVLERYEANARNALER